MACPKCGGRNRRTLGANLFVCEELIPSSTTRWVPHASPQFVGQMAPLVEQHWEPCGERYQEGAVAPAAPICDCGVFAVGICTECGRPVCGGTSCSEQVGGMLLCRGDAAEVHRARATANAEAERARTAARRDEAATKALADEQWERDVRAELATIEDQSERVVRAIVTLARPFAGPALDFPSTDLDGLRALLPELPWTSPPRPQGFSPEYDRRSPPVEWRRRELGAAPPWNHKAIAAWFVRTAVGARVAPRTVSVLEKSLARRERVVARRRNSSGEKVFEIEAWLFEGGSTVLVDFDGRFEYRDAAVTNAGRILVGSVWFQEGGGLNAGALCQMGQDLSLAPIARR